MVFLFPGHWIKMKLEYSWLRYHHCTLKAFIINLNFPPSYIQLPNTRHASNLSWPLFFPSLPFLTPDFRIFCYFFFLSFLAPDFCFFCRYFPISLSPFFSFPSWHQIFAFFHFFLSLFFHFPLFFFSPSFPDTRFSHFLSFFSFLARYFPLSCFSSLSSLLSSTRFSHFLFFFFPS